MANTFFVPEYPECAMVVQLNVNVPVVCASSLKVERQMTKQLKMIKSIFMVKFLDN